MIDTRRTGRTAEHLFLSLVNARGVFATAFDTPSFDGIIFDPRNRCFKRGSSPFYVQIKCRGSSGNTYNTQGYSPKVIDRIRVTAKALRIPTTSVYLVLGFFKQNDIRTMMFFAIPLTDLEPFKGAGQYRFSVELCTEKMSQVGGMFGM